MDIGEPQRVIVVEPLVVPEEVPVTPEPAEPAVTPEPVPVP